jgi:hypothetical protein
VLLSPSCAAPGRTGPMGSIRFDFKLEVESVRFDFKNSSRGPVRLGFDEVGKADGVDGVDGAGSRGR